MLSIQSGVGNAIDDTATLSLLGGGTSGMADQGYADLASGVDEMIGALLLGGVAQARGLTYGSSMSGAAVQSDEYFASTGVVAVGLLGDFNGDNAVDATDYLIWRKDESTFGGNAGYSLWRSNFGAVLASGNGSSVSSAAVPEPVSILLSVLGCGAFGLLRVPPKRLA